MVFFSLPFLRKVSAYIYIYIQGVQKTADSKWAIILAASRGLDEPHD